jgi:hypothetical protein
VTTIKNNYPLPNTKKNNEYRKYFGIGVLKPIEKHKIDISK